MHYKQILKIINYVMIPLMLLISYITVQFGHHLMFHYVFNSLSLKKFVLMNQTDFFETVGATCFKYIFQGRNMENNSALDMESFLVLPMYSI